MLKAYQFFKSYGLLISSLIALLVNILMFTIIISGYPEGNPTEEELFESTIFDFAISSNVWLFWLSILVLLAFSIVQVIRDPKRSIPTFAGTIGVIVLFFILYSTSAGEVRPEYVKVDPSMTPGTVQLVDASLYMTYIFTLGSIAVLVGMSIFTSIRNR